MNKFWGISLAALALGALVLVAGCSKDSSNPAGSSDTDQSALQALMTEDTDLDAVNPWDGDDQIGGGTLDSAITPIAWARHGTFHRTQVNVQMDGDTLATITRTATFDGTLHIVIDTSGGVRTAVDKPMYNTITRKAHARRVARTRFPRENWRIYEVTPTVLLSDSGNTVRPARVQFFVNDIIAPVLDVTDPLNTYYNRDSLPALTHGDLITVVVTPNVTDTVAAYLHPHTYLSSHLPREVMTPNGDNTYSASFTVPDRAGVHVTAADLLSRATLYTSDGAYDAGSWAVPYRVVSPL